MEEKEIFDFGSDDVQENIEHNQDSIFGNYSNDEPDVNDDPVNDLGNDLEEQYDENGNLIENEGYDYLDQALLNKGIDRNNIEITDEYGNIQTVSFDELSDEDKTALLSQDIPAQESPITDNDIAILNYFRANRINSLQEFVDGISQQAVQEYINNSQPEPITSIDGYNNDEVIAYDLIQKFGDEMTDEEIDAEIDRLKEDEEAYNKKVNLLRSYYKNEELAQQKLYEDDQAAKYQQNTQMFQQAYGQAAYNLNTIQGIELEDQDKQELLDFVLTKDQFGRTEFSKALDDPDAVLKMAWGLLYGEQASEAQRNYFAQLLAQERSASRQNQQSNKPRTRAVSRQTPTKTTSSPKQTNSFKF